MKKPTKPKEKLVKVKRKELITQKEKEVIVDATIENKWCPFINANCKGLVCVFGEEEGEYAVMFHEDKRSEIVCKLLNAVGLRKSIGLDVQLKTDED